MLIATNELRALQVRAIDKPIGYVQECYFDDAKWTIRYLVVNFDSVIGRPVLISPIAVVGVDVESGIDLALTEDQIRKSPGIEQHRPVSRQFEQTYDDYYGYPPYWIGSGYWGAAAYPRAALALQPASPRNEATRTAARDGDSHLRSTEEVTGYHIHASDGEVGHVDDFLLDEETWAIHFLRIDTSNFIGGKTVLIPQHVLRNVSWPERRIYVALSREQVRNSPEYDPSRLRLGDEQRIAR